MVQITVANFGLVRPFLTLPLPLLLVINDFPLLFVLKVENLLSFAASKTVGWESAFKLCKYSWTSLFVGFYLCLPFLSD